MVFFALTLVFPLFFHCSSFLVQKPEGLGNLSNLIFADPGFHVTQDDNNISGAGGVRGVLCFLGGEWPLLRVGSGLVVSGFIWGILVPCGSEGGVWAY